MVAAAVALRPGLLPQPDALPNLHHAAAAYFEARGEHEAAVQHFLQADEPAFAAEPSS